MMKRLVGLIVFLILIGSVAGASAAGPEEVVKAAADELAAALQGHREEYANDVEALYAMIDRILLPRFDRRYAAQLVLGRNWRSADAMQRDRFIKAFYRSLLQRYAEGILEFEQKRINILPFRGDLTKTRTTVKTQVTLDDGTKVAVNYGMVKRDKGWLMFDVTIEGISYVRNFRTEVNSEIHASGLDAVIERLEGEEVSHGEQADSE